MDSLPTVVEGDGYSNPTPSHPHFNRVQEPDCPTSPPSQVVLHNLSESSNWTVQLRSRIFPLPTNPYLQRAHETGHMVNLVNPFMPGNVRNGGIDEQNEFGADRTVITRDFFFSIRVSPVNSPHSVTAESHSSVHAGKCSERWGTRAERIWGRSHRNNQRYLRFKRNWTVQL